MQAPSPLPTPSHQLPHPLASPARNPAHLFIQPKVKLFQKPSFSISPPPPWAGPAVEAPIPRCRCRWLGGGGFWVGCVAASPLQPGGGGCRVG